MHYDVKFGETVVMTVTDVDAAARLAEALDDATQYGFQTEGLRSHVVETDRGPEVAPEGEGAPSDDEVYYGLNADAANAFIRNHEDLEDVKALLLVERAHPRYDGGRSSVIDDAEEYLGELLT